MKVIEETRESLETLKLILSEVRAQREAGTELLALSRGAVNNMLWSGMAKPDASGNWNQTFQVPFAAVAFADPNGLGLTIGTGTAGQGLGPGVVVTDLGDAGCVPLIGTQLFVTPKTAGAFFIAVFTRPQAFFWSKG